MLFQYQNVALVVYEDKLFLGMLHSCVDMR
jgi:hypothetical protein